MKDGIDFSKIPEGRFKYNVMPRGAGETYYKIIISKTYNSNAFVWTLDNNYNFKHNIFKLIPSYYFISTVAYSIESQSVFFSDYCYNKALKHKDKVVHLNKFALLYYSAVHVMKNF